MRILKSKSRNAASTLLVVIMFVGILTVGLGSYLALTSNENQSVFRSRSWNAAMPLAEAGIEEAMSQIQINALNYSADGWTNAGPNFYTRRRDVGNDYFITSIQGTATNGLTLSSTGFVQSVSITDHGNYNSVASSYVSRAVQVTAQLSEYPVPVGIVAKTSLSFGGNLGVDSYDTQTLATSSTNTSAIGMYDSTKKSALAFVGCVSSAPLALSGNEHIYGYAASGVGALSPTANGSASIGDFSQTKGVEAGYVTNNFYIALPDVVAPYSSANPPTAVSTNLHGQTCNYFLNGGNYMISSIAGKYIYVANNSILYVTGDAAAARITFATTATNAAKLDLYVGGTSLPVVPLYNELTNSGGTYTLSQAVAPAQLKLLGMNSCTNLSMTGNSSLLGCIYAPHVNFKAQGNANVYGSFTVDTFSCGGTFKFHYDLGLSNAVSKTTLRILSWAER
jgi:hypothetical protein